MECSPHVRASFALARALRQPIEGRWQRLIELGMPYRTDFREMMDFGVSAAPAVTVYDETGMNSIDECAARLLDGIVPQGVQWALFIPGPGASVEFEGSLALWQNELFDQLGQSNFYVEAADCFKDMAGLGNWCIKAIPGDWRRPLHFQSISLVDVWVTPGRDGGIADIHVRHRLPLYAVRAQYPGAELEGAQLSNPTRQVSVMESWIKDIDAPTERWVWEAHLDNKVLARGEEQGYGSCPYVFGRWGKSSGALYGVGQGMMALPAIEVTNEVVRQILAHAELGLSGLWQAADDGVLNPWAVQITPGAIIAKAPGSEGLQPLAYPMNKFDAVQLQLSEQRFNIRKALFAETLGAREGTPPSATEVETRMAELARSVGPSISRVWWEFCVPLLARVRFLMDRKGLTEMPAIDGHKLRVAPVSALVRAAMVGEVSRLDRLLVGVAQHYGPNAVPSVVPVDRYVDFARRRLGIPANVALSEDERRRQAARTASLVGDAVESPEGGLGPLLASMGQGVPRGPA